MQSCELIRLFTLASRTDCADGSRKQLHLSPSQLSRIDPLTGSESGIISCKDADAVYQAFGIACTCESGGTQSLHLRVTGH